MFTLRPGKRRNQWMPRLAWDDDAKVLLASYYDDRADSDSAYVYVAVSYPDRSIHCGRDWQATRVGRETIRVLLKATT